MKIEDLIALGMTQDQAEKAVKLAEDEQAKKVAEAEAKKQSEIDALSAKNNAILSEINALQAKQEAEQEEKAKLKYEKNKAFCRRHHCIILCDRCKCGCLCC